jgi:hypothetical protein
MSKIFGGETDFEARRREVESEAAGKAGMASRPRMRLS